ncbi:MAG: protease HtpX [Candidatus Absconditabacterales bacterium]
MGNRLKRIGLLILTNLFIMIGIYVLLFILEKYFNISLGGNYLGILFYGVIIGFGGAIVSLMMSKMTAKRMYGIQSIDPVLLATYPRKLQNVYNIVQRITHEKMIPMPEIGYYDSQEVNAFATGATKSSALVAVSTGLLDSMDDEQISGVIGHEMAHIINGDMVTMTLLQGIMNTFVFFLSRLIAGGRGDDEGRSSYNPLIALLCEVLFGILGSIVVNQFSQYREYKADEGSAKFLGKQPMISALQKLMTISDEAHVPHDEFATMKIFGGKRMRMDIFATHPSLPKRIERLKHSPIT